MEKKVKLMHCAASREMPIFVGFSLNPGRLFAVIHFAHLKNDIYSNRGKIRTNVFYISNKLVAIFRVSVGAFHSCTLSTIALPSAWPQRLIVIYFNHIHTDFFLVRKTRVHCTTARLTNRLHVFPWKKVHSYS